MVEGASLENWNTGNRIGGSNPSLSASPFRWRKHWGFWAVSLCSLRLGFRPSGYTKNVGTSDTPVLGLFSNQFCVRCSPSLEDRGIQQEMNWGLERHGYSAESEARREFIVRNSTGVTKGQLVKQGSSRPRI